MTSPASKCALVTGAAHRIGRAIAADLAAHGWSVAIHANRSTAAAQDLADALRAKHGVTTAVISGDLSKADDVAGIVPAAASALGGLSLLVNNASIFEDDAAGTVSSERFRRHMAVNAEAPALLTSAFAALAGRGLVVNMLDQRVFKPTPRFLSYSASKAALWWLTRTMAQALAPDIRVVALGPGPVLKAERQTDADFASMVDALPLARAPDLAEFGRAIRFLWEMPSVTGQMLALDGGQHLAWATPDAVVVE